MTAIIRALRTDINTVRTSDQTYDNVVLNQYGHIKGDINQIKSVDIDVNVGNRSDGTQRITIADDDTNLANISSKINTMQTDIASLKTTLDNIYTILNDIWDDVNNRIRVLSQTS